MIKIDASLPKLGMLASIFNIHLGFVLASFVSDIIGSLHYTFGLGDHLCSYTSVE